MKKIIYILLTCAIFLSACSTKEEMANPEIQPETEETSAIQNEEETTTTEIIEEEITTTIIALAEEIEETGEVDTVITDNVYEYFDVPRPFPEEICFVDDNKYFYNTYVEKFGNFPGFFDECVSKYFNTDISSISEEYNSKYFTKNRLGIKNDTIKLGYSLYTLFKEYNIPKEEIINFLNEHNNGRIALYEQYPADIYLEECYTEEEIAAIADLDKDALNELFVSDYCIVKGRSIYTPEWLYCHSLEDYVIAGITPDDVKEKLSYFYEFPYDDEAAVFFGDKLSEFTGETVIFQDWETKLAETEE